jgi:hypothetical protein
MHLQIPIDNPQFVRIIQIKSPMDKGLQLCNKKIAEEFVDIKFNTINEKGSAIPELGVFPYL